MKQRMANRAASTALDSLFLNRWSQLGLQALKLGHHMHGMTGIDFDKVRDLLAVPDRFRIEAAVAIGRAADSAILAEGLRDREVPSDRKPLEEIAFAGWFVS